MVSDDDDGIVVERLSSGDLMSPESDVRPTLVAVILECPDWSIIVGDLRERLVLRARIRVFLRAPARLRGVASVMAIDQRLSVAIDKH